MPESYQESRSVCIFILMQAIYVFSGLGADERVFQKMNLAPYQPVFIRWIQPLPNESMQDYCSRLREQIKEADPILIGLSFGGMVAVEIARQIQVKKVILIASAKNRYEIPFYFRWTGLLHLNRLIPASLLKTTNFITYWMFDTSEKEDHRLLKDILPDTDGIFLKWAIDQIIHWKNTEIPANVIHIHGTADRILPLSFVKSDFRIPGGGHFMTLHHAEEIDQIIGKILQ